MTRHEHALIVARILIRDSRRGHRVAVQYCQKHLGEEGRSSCPAYDFNVGPLAKKAAPVGASQEVIDCLDFEYETYVLGVTDAVETYQDLACLLCWNGSSFDATCIGVLRASLGVTLAALYDEYCDAYDLCVGA